jgi:hypothetical protein
VARGSTSPPCKALGDLLDGGEAKTREISSGGAKLGYELGRKHTRRLGFMGGATLEGDDL